MESFHRPKENNHVLELKKNKVVSSINRFTTFISAPSEIKSFIAYSIIIVLTTCSNTFTSTIKTGIISKNLGTLSLDAYVITYNIISSSSGVIVFFTYGIAAQISQHLAKNEFEMIGRRMNAVEVFGIFFSIFVIFVLWLLREPFLLLYNPPPNLVETIHPFFNAYLSVVPLIIYSCINGGIMIGLRALFLRLIIEMCAIAIDFALVSLFMLYFKLGLYSVLYAYLISRIFCECAHFSYLYRPANIRKFRLFKKITWRFTDKEFLMGFASDSGFLVGRGVVLMSQYMVTPIIASRLGTNELAAYSIMSPLFSYPNLISDALGTVCNIKGSQYIGLKKYSYYNRLVIICPFVALFIAFIFLSVYGFARHSVFSLFTNDPLVMIQIENVFPYWMFTIFLGSLPGTFEGFTMAKQNFGLMFIVMVTSMLMWVPITCANIIWLQELTLIYVALMVFMWTRFLPLMVINFWELYKERHWVDGVTPTPLVEESKIEESPLLINC